MKTLEIGLHGFLGDPQDLRLIRPDLKCWDYLKMTDLGPATSLEDWGRAFWNQQTFSAVQNPIHLVGYSLGGRLALSAFHHSPQRVKKLVLLAAQFYFPEEERAARKIWDSQWAARFRNEEWEKVVSAWNSLPIFEGSQAEPERREADFDREVLALILEKWSPASQQDYTAILNNSSVPVLFVVGEYDRRYMKLKDRLTGSNIQISVVPKAGHRVWYDQPGVVRDLVGRFLDSN
ncbi:MAG: alpha/beta fold hydrolase [Pseudobdellovibrionaceae bacterium]